MTRIINRNVCNGLDDLPHYEKPIQKYPRWNTLEDNVLMSNVDKMKTKDIVNKINAMFHNGRTLRATYKRISTLKRRNKGGGDVQSKPA